MKSYKRGSKDKSKHPKELFYADFTMEDKGFYAFDIHEPQYNSKKIFILLII